MTSIVKCRKPECPVMIYMLLYRKTGKWAPVEAEPSPQGNIDIDLENSSYIILTGEFLENARKVNRPLHLNHFGTCEYARGFGGHHAGDGKSAAAGERL